MASNHNIYCVSEFTDFVVFNTNKHIKPCPSIFSYVIFVFMLSFVMSLKLDSAEFKIPLQDTTPRDVGIYKNVRVTDLVVSVSESDTGKFTITGNVRSQYEHVWFTWEVKKILWRWKDKVLVRHSEWRERAASSLRVDGTCTLDVVGKQIKDINIQKAEVQNFPLADLPIQILVAVIPQSLKIP